MHPSTCIHHILLLQLDKLCLSKSFLHKNAHFLQHLMEDLVVYEKFLDLLSMFLLMLKIENRCTKLDNLYHYFNLQVLVCVLEKQSPDEP